MMTSAWKTLESFHDELEHLPTSTGYISLSFEEVYRCVYNICIQRGGKERLYKHLLERVRKAAVLLRKQHFQWYRTLVADIYHFFARTFFASHECQLHKLIGVIKAEELAKIACAFRISCEFRTLRQCCMEARFRPGGTGYLEAKEEFDTNKRRKTTM